jgi:glutathione peroxidase
LSSPAAPAKLTRDQHRPASFVILPPDIALKTIDGDARTLGDFTGQALLIVNVASKCGFTPQYAGLETLHRRFRERGLAVLGFPCDQFGHQEPGDESAIRAFCEDNYDVTFPMFAKIEVNGDNAPPAVQGAEAAGARLVRNPSDQMEFHQVPSR